MAVIVREKLLLSASIPQTSEACMSSDTEAIDLAADAAAGCTADMLDMACQHQTAGLQLTNPYRSMQSSLSHKSHQQGAVQALRTAGALWGQLDPPWRPTG